MLVSTWVLLDHAVCQPQVFSTKRGRRSTAQPKRGHQREFGLLVRGAAVRKDNRMRGMHNAESGVVAGIYRLLLVATLYLVLYAV